MILIVDDKKENLLSLQSLLNLHGYSVHAAESGEDALKKVLHHNYGLIILDVQMPGMDGFEVAEIISSYSKTQDTPIIFLSAVSIEKKFITKGYSSGAIDYITKPIDPDIFLLKVNTLYKLYEQKRQLNEMQLNLRNEVEFRKKAQEESQIRAHEFVSILESIPQIAFTTNPDGELEYGNNEWMTYSGSLHSFPETHPEDDSLINLVKIMAASGKPVEREVRIRKQGQQEYRCFLLRTVPVKKEEEIVKWVGTLTDIEEQKQASKRKDEFISVASHELKTPLTSMKGYIQLLQRTVQGDQSMQLYVDRTLVQINKLDNLITELLDISKIESGRLKLDIHEFSFQKLLSNALDMIRLNHPDYMFEQTEKVDVLVNGDEAKLEQVVHNFLSNAVKYSPGQKKVLVHCKLLPGNLLEVGIQDFGIGIPKDVQQFVFDKFYRTPESVSNFQGLGIGLYISADILQRHKAEYGLESEPGKGSTFYFRIPYKKNINHGIEHEK